MSSDLNLMREICYSSQNWMHCIQAIYERYWLQRRLAAWRGRECQGRPARVNNIDHSMSFHVTNLHLSDEPVKFVVTTRLQLTKCKARLHTYYSEAFSQQCSRCGFSIETASHLLNGCKESKNSFQSRHRRVVDINARAVKDRNQDALIRKDSTMKPRMLGTSSLTYA